MRAATATFSIYAISFFLFFGTALALGFLLPNYRDQQAEIVMLRNQLDQEKTKVGSCIHDLTLAQDVVADVKGSEKHCQTRLSLSQLALAECRDDLQSTQTKLDDSEFRLAGVQREYNNITAIYKAATVPSAKTDSRAVQKPLSSFPGTETIGMPLVAGIALATLTFTLVALLIGFTVGLSTA